MLGMLRSSYLVLVLETGHYERSNTLGKQEEASGGS